MPRNGIPTSAEIWARDTPRPGSGASGPASRAKPNPSPPEQGLAGETVPHTSGNPSADPATQGGDGSGKAPIQSGSGPGVWAQMPESRPSAPEAGRPGSGAGSGIIPSNVSESGTGIPPSHAEAGNVQAGRAGPSGAVASAKASPVHWAQPHAPGSSAHSSAISRPTAGTRQLRDCRQPRALPPGEPLEGCSGPRITSPSRP